MWKRFVAVLRTPVVWELWRGGRGMGERVRDVFVLICKVTVEDALFVEWRWTVIWVAGESVWRVPDDSSKGECDERREVVRGEE